VWDTIPGFCGYSATDTIHINYKPRILDIQNNDTLVCYGTQIQMVVNGTPGYTYQWLPGTNVSNPADQNPVITANNSETYTLTASYPGCADTTQSVAIAVDLPGSAHFEAQPDSICTGQSIAFVPQSDSTVVSQHWSFGDGNGMTSGNESMINHAYDNAGVFPVELTLQFRACPEASFTDSVYVYALPSVYLGPDSGLCLNGNAIRIQNLEPAPTVAFHNLWNTGDTTAILNVLHPGMYNLTISTEPLGCSTTESITITKDCYIDIPNAFTPNGDGENDYFFPRQLLSKKVTRFDMKVWDRWGEIIFKTNSINGRGWDGKFNGKPQPIGVYIYIIDVEIDGKNNEHYQGNVTLVR
jgi:gliding motility-associated-like protein